MTQAPGKFDSDYRDKIAQAVAQAIMEASIVETNGRRVAHLRINEIVDSFGMALAFLTCSHREAVTPHDRRLLAEDMTERLFRLMDELRKAGVPNMFLATRYDDDTTH